MAMSMAQANELASYTPQQLGQWGLMKRVRREELIDKLLTETKEPEAPRIEELRAEQIEEMRLKGEEEINAWMRLEGITEEDWRISLIRQARWLDWCEKEYGDNLAEYFQTRKRQLDTASYSIIRVSNEAVALELYLRIKEREATFEELAEKFSEGPERKYGGKVGPVPLSKPHPQLANLIQISEEGRLWPPKELERKWLIIRVNEKISASLNTKTRKRLLLELGEQGIRKMVEKVNTSNG